MIACFLSNISAKYYKNPSMFSRVIAKNVGDVFWDTVYILNVIVKQEYLIKIGKQKRWRIVVLYATEFHSLQK